MVQNTWSIITSYDISYNCTMVDYNFAFERHEKNNSIVSFPIDNYKFSSPHCTTSHVIDWIPLAFQYPTISTMNVMTGHLLTDKINVYTNVAVPRSYGMTSFHVLVQPQADMYHSVATCDISQCWLITVMCTLVSKYLEKYFDSPDTDTFILLWDNDLYTRGKYV